MKKYITILSIALIVSALAVAVWAETTMPFTDVQEGAYYYDAVTWAVENGITNGTGDDTFSPDAPMTRAQVVTMLYRYWLKFGDGIAPEIPTEPETTEPVETEPVETEAPPETEAPTEPEETEPSEPAETVVFEFSYPYSDYSGEEIILERLDGDSISLTLDGVGARFSSGDTVQLEYFGASSVYLRGVYSYVFDMSLEQPVTALLNRECTVEVVAHNEIIITGCLPVEMVRICVIGSRNEAAFLRITKC